jgi:hypothetical protein
VSSADRADGARVRTILCAGVAVLDQVFRLDRFPVPQAKACSSAFAVVGGGCAANAAVAAARLNRYPWSLRPQFKLIYEPQVRQRSRQMSVIGGKAENMCSYRVFRLLDPEATCRQPQATS